ncbi:hypothetical protein [Massilibacteroides vaginae]|uniref:hypothetical protein n=1 Tax=Massilibacteroides vaginae TaxID=1673718 RepID=UPI00111C100C|nr:hypothetical protein [Massilibacteroides vaginae]
MVSGIHDIYVCLFDEIDFGRIFNCCPASRSVMKDIVMARLSQPCSKRTSVEMQERDYGIKIPLEKVYRMMDVLTDARIKQLQQLSWNHSRSLLTKEVKIMFYDCTAPYFESFTEDEFQSFGYSKDHKFNQG